jgi:hypothetical protein
MKKTTIPGLILCLMIGACSTDIKTPLEGEWRLAYEYEITDGNTTILYPGSSKGGEIKIWSGNYWALLGRFEQDTGFSQNFGGGTFTLDGNRYVENVQYHSAPEYLDQKVKLLVEFKKDTVIQTWPVDDKGEVITSGSYYIEKWARIK